MRRVVLDTSVMVAAVRSRHGASHLLLERVARRMLVPLVTQALFLEYEDVLKRPEQREVSRLTLAQVDTVLGAFAGLAEPVEVHWTWRPQLRDPADEMVLDAAVNGRAEALVTHNVVDFADVAPRFGIIVLRPGEVLERTRT